MKKLIQICISMLLILLTIISCSPVDYPERLERNPVETSTNIYVTPHSKSAEVKFTPVINADDYVIKQNGIPISVPLKLVDGLYNFTLRKLNPETEYTISIEARNKANKDPITENITTTTFKTQQDNGDLDYAPIAYVYSRSTDGAVIDVRISENIEYKVTCGGTTINSVSPNPREGFLSYNISTGLLVNNPEVIVEHRKINAPIYSAEKTVLKVPEDNINFNGEIILEIPSGSTNITTGVPDNKDYASLLFFTDNSTNAKVLETQKIEAGTDKVHFSLENAGSLSSGAFVIAFSNNGGINASYTNPYYYTTPVFPEVEKSSQTSLTLTWKQPEGLGEDVIYTISGSDAKEHKLLIPPAEVSVDNTGIATLVLENLVSNTDYDLVIEALLPNGEEATSTTPVKTESFSGIYRWVCPEAGAKVPSFVVQVWDRQDAVNKGWNAPDGTSYWNDDYKYHIFVDPTDPAYTSDMAGISIMPLFRNGEDLPSSFIPYKNNAKPYEKGYRWNESKWNATGSLHPLSWKPAQEDEITGDAIVSYMNSKTFAGTLLTKTNFTFRENDGRPQLVFRNAGEGSGANTVNIGLFKNPQPGEGEDKFTFTLDRIGDIPSSKEGSV